MLFLSINDLFSTVCNTPVKRLYESLTWLRNGNAIYKLHWTTHLGDIDVHTQCLHWGFHQQIFEESCHRVDHKYISNTSTFHVGSLLHQQFWKYNSKHGHIVRSLYNDLSPFRHQATTDINAGFSQDNNWRKSIQIAHKIEMLSFENSAHHLVCHTKCKLTMVDVLNLNEYKRNRVLDITKRQCCNRKTMVR